MQIIHYILALCLVYLCYAWDPEVCMACKEAYPVVLKNPNYTNPDMNYQLSWNEGCKRGQDTRYEECVREHSQMYLLLKKHALSGENADTACKSKCD